MERKTVWIVGGGCIGGCVAERLVKEGHAVYVSAPEPSELMGVTYSVLDVCDEGAVQAEAGAFAATGLDGLVYTAGVSMAAPFVATEDADARRLFDVNFFGFASVVRAALPALIETKGRIVAVGSMGGVFPLPFDPFYSASKAALAILSEELNLELRPFGVASTVVLAGGTRTPFSYHRKIYGRERTGAYEAAMLSAACKLIETEQNGDPPETVADCICSVLSDGNPPPVVASGIKNKALRLAKRLMSERAALAAVRHKML